MAGYSETPLVRKLGLREGERVQTIGAPKNYAVLLGELPEGASISSGAQKEARFVHLFVTQLSVLKKQLQQLRAKLADDGTLWVSWPKKAAKVPTDVTENIIRDVALPLGFVDIKICAVDEIWSGLKLVVRRTNRKTAT